jgi:GNAT superfamily N-acetyltransferase
VPRPEPAPARPDATAYDIVRWEPGFKGRVAELQRHLWRGDAALNRAYLEWKYERNPYVDEPLIYLAVRDGEVVGMRGMFGSCWEAGPRAERALIPCADDFVIAPAHRTRGLFRAIMRLAMDDLASRGHACTLSLSAGPVTLAGSLADGWRAVAPMRPAIRDGRRTFLANRLRSRLGRLPFVWRYAGGSRRALRARPFARLDARAHPMRAGDQARVGMGRMPRADLMADLVRRLGHDGRVRHVRDEAYLVWRFANPLHDYRFLYWDSDRLEGYLVLQASRVDGSRPVNIVDWEGATAEVCTGLLRAALEWGRFPELRTWMSALPTSAAGLLPNAGFVPRQPGRLDRLGPSLLVRPAQPGRTASDLTLGGRRLLEGASWDLRMIYSMAG